MKRIAILIDPEKTNTDDIEKIAAVTHDDQPDFFFVGGSTASGSDVDAVVRSLKRHANVPVALFPGAADQFTPAADVLLLLSLISGRNPEFLIGQHVKAAMAIAKSDIKVVPTGYLLIDGGCETTVQRVTQTKPLDPDDLDDIVATALAGQQLGLHAIYLEAGSGAIKPVPDSVIMTVKRHTRLPIIVGGGICDEAAAHNAFDAGADVLVIGNAIEKDPSLAPRLIRLTHAYR